MDSDDDWLEAGPSNQGSSADPLVEQEYQRLATRYTDVSALNTISLYGIHADALQAGYREGITDGKLTTLQEGFDSSFAASVPPSRRLGQLRGQANALLAYLTRSTPGTSSARASTSMSGPVYLAELVEAARELVQDLARVKRVQVLSRDIERERHEQEEHGGEDVFELEPTEEREMEGLEDALGSLGQKAKANGSDEVREGQLLDVFEYRLKALKGRLRA